MSSTFLLFSILFSYLLDTDGLIVGSFVISPSSTPSPSKPSPSKPTLFLYPSWPSGRFSVIFVSYSILYSLLILPRWTLNPSAVISNLPSISTSWLLLSKTLIESSISSSPAPISSVITAFLIGCFALFTWIFQEILESP